jgi:hypothetical protein
MKRMNHFIYPNEEGPQRKKWLKKGPLSFHINVEERGRRQKVRECTLLPSVRKKGGTPEEKAGGFYLRDKKTYCFFSLFYFKLINISIKTICDLFRGCLLFSDLFPPGKEGGSPFVQLFQR